MIKRYVARSLAVFLLLPTFLTTPAIASEHAKDVTLPSLRYEINRSGPLDGAHPTRRATITVEYSVSLTDGTLIDASEKRGTPDVFDLSKLIPAWQVLVPLMRPGDEWTFYVPAVFAYGETMRSKIPANSDLTFRVKLISFLPLRD